jgi:hypothetical protein
MSGDNWAAIITTLITVVSTLGGVALTQRHATTLRRLDFLEQRRVEQRIALENVLTTGQDWVIFTRAVGREPGREEQKDFDAWDYFVENNRNILDAHSRALLTARLVIRDETVRGLVTELTNEGNDLHSKMLRLKDAELRDPDEVRMIRGTIWNLAKSYREQLARLEQLTRDRVLQGTRNGSSHGLQSHLEKTFRFNPERTQVLAALAPDTVS